MYDAEQAFPVVKKHIYSPPKCTQGIERQKCSKQANK